MILVRKGDLFEGGHQAYARGARLDLYMSQGLALKFRSFYPEMEEQYRTLCTAETSVGDVFCYETSDDRPTVFNLLVREGSGQVRVSAFQSAAEKMYHLMMVKNLNDVGMPKIGAGRGSLPEDQFFEGLGMLRDSSQRHVIVYEELRA